MLGENKKIAAFIVESSNDEFIAYASTGNLSDLSSLKKFIEMQYVICERMVNDLTEKLEKENFLSSEMQDKILSTINELYVGMQILEDRATIIEGLKNDKVIKLN